MLLQVKTLYISQEDWNYSNQVHEKVKNVKRYVMSGLTKRHDNVENTCNVRNGKGLPLITL